MLEKNEINENVLENWKKVLESCVIEFESAIEIFQVVQTEEIEVQTIFFSEEKIKNYLLALNNILKVIRFISLSLKSKKEFIEKKKMGSFSVFGRLLDKLDTLWTKLEMNVGTYFNFVTDLKDEIQENSENDCFLCKQKVNNDTSISWEQNFYHDLCVNWWINRVSLNVPKN